MRWMAGFTVSVICTALYAQQTGTICGSVRDEHGAPAAGVLVEAMDAGRGHSGLMPNYVTDAHGDYCVRDLLFGDQFMLTANDPAKGYPAMWVMFYAEHSPVSGVALTPSAPNAVVNWSIPYKAGFLYVRVTDAQTGKPVKDVSEELAVSGEEQNRWIRGGLGSPVLLPPDKTVLLTVKAAGYQNWPAQGAKPLLVTPGAVVKLEVELTPAQ